MQVLWREKKIRLGVLNDMNYFVSKGETTSTDKKTGEITTSYTNMKYHQTLHAAVERAIDLTVNQMKRKSLQSWLKAYDETLDRIEKVFGKLDLLKDVPKRSQKKKSPF